MILIAVEAMMSPTISPAMLAVLGGEAAEGESGAAFTVEP
jgi:hypothetical protein